MRARDFLDKSFKVAVFLKGLDGFMETVGGFLLLFISPQALSAAVVFATQHELSEDPHDLFANMLVQVAHVATFNAHWFFVAYLLSHGMAKIVLAVALLREQMKAYPFAFTFFGLFVCYEIYRFMLNPSWWLPAFISFDLLVMGLIAAEYRRLKKARASS